MSGNSSFLFAANFLLQEILFCQDALIIIINFLFLKISIFIESSSGDLIGITLAVDGYIPPLMAFASLSAFSC